MRSSYSSLLAASVLGLPLAAIAGETVSARRLPRKMKDPHHRFHLAKNMGPLGSRLSQLSREIRILYTSDPNLRRFLPVAVMQVPRVDCAKDS
jgi:hypothetical protein